MFRIVIEITMDVLILKYTLYSVEYYNQDIESKGNNTLIYNTGEIGHKQI